MSTVMKLHALISHRHDFEINLKIDKFLNINGAQVIAIILIILVILLINDCFIFCDVSVYFT